MKTTINFKGFEFEVEFFYEPAEDAVMNYGDGSGYAGYPEQYEFSEITLNGIDASLLLEDSIDYFEEESIKQIKKQSSEW